MNTVGVASQRDVDAIIDDQFAVMRPGCGPRALRASRENHPAAAILARSCNNAQRRLPGVASKTRSGGTTAGLLRIEYGVKRRQFQGHGSRGFFLKLDTQVGNFFRRVFLLMPRICAARI